MTSTGKSVPFVFQSVVFFFFSNKVWVWHMTRPRPFLRSPASSFSAVLPLKTRRFTLLFILSFVLSACSLFYSVGRCAETLEFQNTLHMRHTQTHTILLTAALTQLFPIEVCLCPLLDSNLHSTARYCAASHITSTSLTLLSICQGLKSPQTTIWHQPQLFHCSGTGSRNLISTLNFQSRMLNLAFGNDKCQEFIFICSVWKKKTLYVNKRTEGIHSNWFRLQLALNYNHHATSIL